MGENKAGRMYNTSGTAAKAVWALTFAVIFVLNRMTLMMVDDYRYSFSFVDASERMRSLSQLIPSMKAHYERMNGRLLTHGVVQLILMKCPPILFDILNTAVFCLLIFLMYHYIWRRFHDRTNVLFLLTAVAAVWAFVPAFGEVCLWLDGACNYLWAVTFSLLYLWPLIIDEEREPKLPFRVLYVQLGFVVGGISETCSMAVMGAFVLHFIYDRLIARRKTPWWKIVPVLTMLPWYIYMISSPGTHQNKLGRESLFKGFVTAFEQYLDFFRIHLIIWGILAVLAVYLCRRWDMVIRSFMWLFLAVGMNFMHTFTVGYPYRSMAGVAVYTLIADGILFTALWDDRWKDGRQSGQSRALKAGIISLCVIALMTAFFKFVPGVYDVYTSYLQMAANERTLREADENADVTIPNVHPSTRYAAAFMLKYLDAENPATWPNYSMAYYYGVHSVAAR